ncbi:hypothetical protein [Janthinobacterium sp. PSPC3-1]|uniref:hypothetical protein n=1 Tax=Janthinobacterium sp. PSPC3-1 TaxID=2804653 RepID=UPI003CE90256
MSETIYYKTIKISTGAFVQIEMAIRLEIAVLEHRVDRAHPDATFRRIDVMRLAELRAALVEFTA